jgi:hypothetical protein
MLKDTICSLRKKLELSAAEGGMAVDGADGLVNSIGAWVFLGSDRGFSK